MNRTSPDEWHALCSPRRPHRAARRHLRLPALTRARVIVAAACTTQPAAMPPPHGPRLFVSNEIGGSVSVIDIGTRKVVYTIAVGKRPRGIRAQRRRQGRCMSRSAARRSAGRTWTNRRCRRPIADSTASGSSTPRPEGSHECCRPAPIPSSSPSRRTGRGCSSPTRTPGSPACSTSPPGRSSSRSRSAASPRAWTSAPTAASFTSRPNTTAACSSSTPRRLEVIGYRRRRPAPALDRLPPRRLPRVRQRRERRGGIGARHGDAHGGPADHVHAGHAAPDGHPRRPRRSAHLRHDRTRRHARSHRSGHQRGRGSAQSANGPGAWRSRPMARPPTPRMGRRTTCRSSISRR